MAMPVSALSAKSDSAEGGSGEGSSVMRNTSDLRQQSPSDASASTVWQRRSAASMSPNSTPFSRAALRGVSSGRSSA
eukprot:4225894-Prymnesium_polylepis.1